MDIGGYKGYVVHYNNLSVGEYTFQGLVCGFQAIGKALTSWLESENEVTGCSLEDEIGGAA